MPKRCGSGTCLSRICADGRVGGPAGCLEGGDERREILFEEVVAEVHHEVVVAEEVLAISTQWASPSGASWGM